MTAKKKMMPQTWLEGEQPAGFRIGPNGEVELMTQAEADAVLKRAFQEAMHSAGWPRLGRTLH
jgi:hypothetical protein